MAVNSLGIGIHISVTGNYETKLRSATRLAKGFADVQKDLAKKAEESRQVIVDQAIAFQVLALRFGQVSRAATRVFTSFAGGLVSMVRGAAAFQTQAALLKVFFGSKAETLTGQIYVLSQATGIAIDDLTTVASRLGQAGVSAEQAARATEIVGKAFTTLPASEKARALIQMGRAFDRVQSFNTAFNVVLDKTEEKLFLAASGAKRVEVGILALEKRFGSVTDIMSGNLDFQVQRLIGMFKLLNIRIVLPALEPLTKALRRINIQFSNMLGFGKANEERFEKLQRIFQALISPFVKIVETIGELKLVPKTLEFLANHEEFVKAAGAMTLMATALVGIAAAALSATFAVGGLIRTMQAGGLVGVGGGFLKKSAMGFMKGRGIAGADLFMGGGKLVKDALATRKMFGASTMFARLKTQMFGGLVKPGMFQAISTGVQGLLSNLTTILPLIGNLIARFSALGFIGIFVAAILREAFQPLKANLGEGITHLMNLAKGLYQVFTTGKITLATLQDLENNGFGPLFRILVTFGFFLKDFITGVFGGMEGLGTSIGEFIDVFKFAFQEVTKAVFEVLQDLGLFEEGGSDAFLGLGFTLGNFVKLFLQGTMFIIKYGILPLVQAFTFVAGIVQVMIGAVKEFIAILWGLVSAALALAEGLGLKSIGGVDIAALRMAASSMAADTDAGAAKSMNRGLANITGKEQSPVTITPTPVYMQLDNYMVGKAQINFFDQEDMRNNEGIPQ